MPNIEAEIQQTQQALELCARLLSDAEQSIDRKNERNVVSDTVTPKTDKTKAKNRSANQAALQLLIEAYPGVFSRENVRPLKIGIQEDLVADEKIAKNKIKRALASYVRAPQYFKAMQEGAERVDLQGQASGTVTAEEAAHAREQLKAFHQRRREVQREREKEQRAKEKEERINNKLEQLVSLNKR